MFTITRKQIERLNSLRSPDHFITSLYLQLDPDPRIHLAKLKTLLHQQTDELARKGVSAEIREEVKKDLEKIRHYVERLGVTPLRGLTVFSCEVGGIWEAFLIPREVQDVLVVDNAPFIRPLTRILSKYPTICSLLVNRERARIFEIFMGEIEEEPEVDDEVPARVREAGWYGLREKRIDRHIDEHIRVHLKKTADQTLSLFHEKGFDLLFLGGNFEFLPEMERIFPSLLKQRLKRTFRADINLSAKEVLEETLRLGREVKEEGDRHLVRQLEDSLKGSGWGISGIQETLLSLYEGSIHSLLVEEGFSQKGAYCAKCGFLGLNPGACPACGTAMKTVSDIIDKAVSRAVDQSCAIFHIAPGSGLADLGSMGALLRYKMIKERRKEAQASV